MRRRVHDQIARARELLDGKDPVERTRHVTQSYRRTQGEPAVLRRAKALAHMLRHERIRIVPGELIVGMQQREIHVHQGLDQKRAWISHVSFPEMRGGWLPDGVKVPARVRQDLAYWQHEETPGKALNARRSDADRKAQQRGLYYAGGWLSGHAIPDFGMVLTRGLRAVAATARRALSGEGRLAEPPAWVIHDARPARTSSDFHQAILIVCDAARRYARRYADLAHRMAQVETDPQRRADLTAVEAICRRVPWQPARTFHEALQCVFLVHRICEIEMGGPGATANSLGRVDQYLYPFYRADLDSGRLTRDGARDLIQLFFAKLHRSYTDSHMMIGGQTQGGSDATNDLTYLWLEAYAEARLPVALAVRFHRCSPPDLLEKACEVISLGMGRPDLWNDEVVVPALTAKGLPLHYARDYAVVGCVELTVQGCHDSRTMAHTVNLLKCLELALNDGRCMLTGDQVGPRTGTRLADFANVLQAFEHQVRHAVDAAVETNLLAERIQPSVLPMPFHSAATPDCLDRGLDMTEGGARLNSTGPCAHGIADAANALAAIHDLCFADGSGPPDRRLPRMALDELTDILRRNFEGHEPLRQMLRHRAPKYGNGHPAADALAREVARTYCDALADKRNCRGGRFHPLIFGVTSGGIYHMGPATAASADGRLAGAPLAIGLSPAIGTDRSGPTRSLLSAAHLWTEGMAGGASCVIDLHPSAFAGPDAAKKVAALVQSYFDEGGIELGINVLSAERLRQAQHEPQAHRGLMVRLFGFSAEFVTLDPELQDWVITKTKHGP